MAQPDLAEQPTSFKSNLGWLLVIGLSAFAVPFAFSSILHWPRSAFLVPYLLIIGGEMLLYLRWVGFGLRDLAYHWPAGLGLALAGGAFVVLSLERYPVSPAPEGIDLVSSLAWVGVAYGTVDALLLNVFPVLVARSLGFTAIGRPWLRASLRGAAALVISAVLSLVYHLGYAEFRGPGVASPVFGNVLITATYVASGNPLAPIITHVAMHIGAIEHGIETVPQLPPHEP